jgi:hypothetical protein
VPVFGFRGSSSERSRSSPPRRSRRDEQVVAEKPISQPCQRDSKAPAACSGVVGRFAGKNIHRLKNADVFRCGPTEYSVTGHAGQAFHDEAPAKRRAVSGCLGVPGSRFQAPRNDPRGYSTACWRGRLAKPFMMRYSAASTLATRNSSRFSSVVNPLVAARPAVPKPASSSMIAS